MSDYDSDKVDDLALAIMQLGKHAAGAKLRTWKGFSSELLNRLYERGLIEDPNNKARSVVLTEAGERACADRFERLVGQPTT